MNYAILICLAIIAVAFAFILYAIHILPNGYHRFTVNNATFRINYTALTEQQQEQGLMNKTVGENTTMLFVFQKPGDYPFWMYNTYYPLDMIWISGTKVVYVQYNATPCIGKAAIACPIYNPETTADKVLEVHSGFAEEHGITVGTSIAFS